MKAVIEVLLRLRLGEPREHGWRRRRGERVEHEHRREQRVVLLRRQRDRARVGDNREDGVKVVEFSPSRLCRQNAKKQSLNFVYSSRGISYVG